MPNTTNFNWPTPADTDLVKDGAAAIRNLGNGVDTSLIDLKGGTTGQILSKASNADMDFTYITPNVGDLTEVQAGVGISVASGTGPIPIITNSSTDLITTAGDLLYGTAADTVARLGIGTASQVLAVNSSATAPEWVAPAIGGSLRFIARTTFSNVASQIFDNVFTSSYEAYYVEIEDILAATDSDDLQMQLRYGSSTETTGYYTANIGNAFNTNTLTNYGASNAAQINLNNHTGDATNPTFGHLHFYRVGNTSEIAGVIGNLFSLGVGVQYRIGVTAATAQTYTGFLLKSSSTNISGTVSIYGLAKS